MQWGQNSYVHVFLMPKVVHFLCKCSFIIGFIEHHKLKNIVDVRTPSLKDA